MQEGREKGEQKKVRGKEGIERTGGKEKRRKGERGETNWKRERWEGEGNVLLSQLVVKTWVRDNIRISGMGLGTKWIFRNW